MTLAHSEGLVPLSTLDKKKKKMISLSNSEYSQFFTGRFAPESIVIDAGII